MTTVDLTLDGKRVASLPSAGRGARVATLAVPAGAHTLGVALIRRRDIEGVEELFAVHAESSGIASFTVNGPLHPTGTGDTPSRRRIFSCYPSGAAEEPACAAEILEGLATRAYRRPVAADDSALATLIDFYAAGRAEGSFDAGIQRALARLLVDPEFIFRIEDEPAELPAGSCLPRQRRRSRVALVVFPLEQHSRRRAARRGCRRRAAQARRARARSTAHARRPEGRCARRRASRCSGCSCAWWTPCRRRPGSSTAICARRCARKPSCCSRAWCARIAASSTCSTPTTRSSTSGSRGTTACRTSAAAASVA